MRSQTKSILINSAVGVVASVLIFVVIRTFLGPNLGILRIDWFERPIDFLQPSWFYLVLLVPYFFVVRTVSLTDVSNFQQYLSTLFRSVVLAGIAIALARPTWTDTDNKIATIVLVDVSESVSDKQLAQSRDYARSVMAAKGSEDRVFLVSFAEHPYFIRDGKPDSWVGMDAFSIQTGSSSGCAH